jgi:hypothetical protein
MRSPEFNLKDPKQMVDWLNSLLQRGLTLANNFSGEIIEVTLSAGAEKQIPHRLKAVPKYRIILRQNAGVVIYDGSETWNQNYITLVSSADVTATILLMRG